MSVCYVLQAHNILSIVMCVMCYKHITYTNTKLRLILKFKQSKNLRANSM